MHDRGFALLYAPSPVTPGSWASHFCASAWPDLVMELFTSGDAFDQLDLTPAQLEDVGHTLLGGVVIFSDDVESGITAAWTTTVP